MNYKGGKTSIACPSCGETFQYWPSQRGNAVFCSRACYAQSLKGKTPHNKGLVNTLKKLCKECGLEFDAVYQKSRLFCSRRCFALGETGEKSPLYKGGHSGDRFKGVGKIAYYKWRLSIVVRDGGRCKWCDFEERLTYSRLEVHHIVPISGNPEGICDSANAITLCREHHDLTRGREDQYAVFLSGLVGQPLRAVPCANRKDKQPLRATAVELKDLYVHQRLSANAVGRRFNVSGVCISKYLRRYGIEREVAA